VGGKRHRLQVEPHLVAFGFVAILVGSKDKAKFGAISANRSIVVGGVGVFECPRAVRVM